MRRFGGGGSRMSVKRCPFCNRILPDFIKEEKIELTSRENEILQNECLKLQRRIDKLEYKHDYEDLTSWQLNEVNDKISVYKRMLEVLEGEI